MRGRIAEESVGDARELVGDGELLEQAENHQQGAAQNFPRVGRVPIVKIGEEMARAHDGAGHQLREERDVERVIDDVGDDFLLAAVDIDHVGHALEGVEADAHRQDDVQRERIEWPGHHPRQIAGQEIVVLEEAEKTEVGG